MSEKAAPDYEVQDVETAFESADLQVRLFTLAAGQVIPWHFHSKVSDVFVGLEGITRVETRAPKAIYELQPGQHCLVPPKTAHQVCGKDGQACRFALTQGVGDYDFVPVGGGAS